MDDVTRDPIGAQLLNAAIIYARRGWRVFPLWPGTKRPRVKGWQEQATTDVDVVRDWWVDRFYGCNIGIATGRESGLFLFDVDTKSDRNGILTLSTLENHYGPLPLTYRQDTPSNGIHHLFRYPEGEWRNSVDKVGLGLDVRANGGLFVAAPSVIEGEGSYRIVYDGELAEVPQWILEKQGQREDKPIILPSDCAQYEGLSEEEQTRVLRYTRTAVRNELDRLVQCRNGGLNWDNTTYQVACNLAELANSPWNPYTMEDAYNDLFREAPRDRDFDDRRVNVKFESALHSVQGGCRAFPEPPQPTTADDVDPHVFFDRLDGLKVVDLAEAVLQRGPLARGDDARFWEYKNGVWTTDDRGTVVEGRVAKLTKNKFRTTYPSTVEKMLDTMVAKIHCEPTPDYVNFKNGLLHWKTGNLLEHDQNLMSTVQLAVDYDENAECPEFDQFLSEVVAPDAIGLMWQIVGYLMFSGNPFHVAILCKGGGRNGKGTFLKVMEALLGGDNVSAVTLDSLTGNRFAGAALYGKIANIAGDIDASYLKQTAMFKAFTGEDRVYAERKYGAQFGFNPWAVPVFSINGMFSTSDNSVGFFSRWIVVEFPNDFEGKEDRTLKNRLRTEEELKGVAAHGIRALRELMEQGRFSLPFSAELAKEDMKAKIDPVRVWAEECCELLPNVDINGDPVPEHLELRGNLWESFKLWEFQNGFEGNRKITATKFYDHLEKGLGIKYKRTSNGRFFVNIKVVHAPMKGHESGFYPFSNEDS